MVNPSLLHRVDGAREVLLERDRHELERAGGRFRQRRIERRAVAARHHETAGSEHGARAQDGADVVRVGHLIEHHERPAGIRGRRDFVQARLGQRLGLEQHALVHGVGAEQAVEVARTDALRGWRPASAAPSRFSAFSVISRRVTVRWGSAAPPLPRARHRGAAAPSRLAPSGAGEGRA